MRTSVGEFVLEVAPGVLKIVDRCSIAELVGAALMLLVADNATDVLWAGRFQVVEAALSERCVPVPGQRARSEASLVVAGMAVLPSELRPEIGRRLRAGITARDAALCR